MEVTSSNISKARSGEINDLLLLSRSHAASILRCSELDVRELIEAGYIGCSYVNNELVISGEEVLGFLVEMCRDKRTAGNMLGHFISKRNWNFEIDEKRIVVGCLLDDLLSMLYCSKYELRVIIERNEINHQVTRDHILVDLDYLVEDFLIEGHPCFSLLEEEGYSVGVRKEPEETWFIEISLEDLEVFGKIHEPLSEEQEENHPQSK